MRVIYLHIHTHTHLEYCPGYTLERFLGSPFSGGVTKFYASEIASALLFLHCTMNVVHRDINVSAYVGTGASVPRPACEGGEHTFPNM